MLRLQAIQKQAASHLRPVGCSLPAQGRLFIILTNVQKMVPQAANNPKLASDSGMDSVIFEAAH